MSIIVVTDDLKEFIQANPRIKEVHFTADGAYPLNVYEREVDGKKQLYAPGADQHVTAGSHGQVRSDYAIVATKTREEILAASVEVADQHAPDEEEKKDETPSGEAEKKEETVPPVE